MFPKKLQRKIDQRTMQDALRSLGKRSVHVDFCSNDYLGFSGDKEIAQKAHHLLRKKDIVQNGATGSRLLSGNHILYNEVEKYLSKVHQADATLIFNSGYDANLGFFGAVPQRGDIILYDELIHASIRDGIQMSNAKSYKFSHNNAEDLARKLKKFRLKTNLTTATEIQEKSIHHNTENLEKDNFEELTLSQIEEPAISIVEVPVLSGVEVYVVTESVFSMDGDSPDLVAFSKLCNEYYAHLVVDEAHAVGVFDNGLVQHYNLHQDIFARIITFGKALGSHGAAVLGSADLITYLINFSRSFIYTTALPPHTLATIKAAYHKLETSAASQKLHQNIAIFQDQIKKNKLQGVYIQSNSAIQTIVISGNKEVKEAASYLQRNNFEVSPILSPTVPKGKERLRFCLHSYNTQEEIATVLSLLATFVRT
ncbi:pyridoxal phosphate-dependent aminotransferase family protein [Gangjinia marincola]|uniref:Pyridoxal phosphate-dependent aminotransferase family protein n=1 Tax=Gangjinia marincola TaxID=578463 RepID=A0ABP3XX34_9FLAO